MDVVKRVEGVSWPTLTSLGIVAYSRWLIDLQRSGDLHDKEAQSEGGAFPSHWVHPGDAFQLVMHFS